MTSRITESIAAVAILLCVADVARCHEATEENSPVVTETAPVETVAPEATTEVKKPWYQIGMPSMPEVSWRPSWPTQTIDAITPDENPFAGAAGRVSDASKRASQGVRGAWGAMVGRFSGSDDQQAATRRVAKRESPGFWSRMFGAKEEPQGSQTVTEFLAQERLGTTRR